MTLPSLGGCSGPCQSLPDMSVTRHDTKSAISCLPRVSKRARAMPVLLDLSAESRELVAERLVATVDDADAVHGRRALGRERGDEVREAAAQVGHLDLRARQGRRAGDGGRVQEVALAEAARLVAQALLVQLHVGAHLHQGLGEAE